MQRFILVLFLFFFGNLAQAQSLRQSLLQYQFNALPLNPAYAGSVGTLSLDAAYFGNFVSQGEVSRSGVFSLHAPAGERGNRAWGTVFSFYKTYFFGEASISPSYAYRLQLPNGGTLSLGGTVGFNYFDVNATILTVVQNDFFSVNGGMGAYYQAQRFFVGLSTLNLFEKSFGAGSNDPDESLPRENPYSLHTGCVFPIYQDLQLKPVVLLQYNNVYDLPDNPASTNAHLWSFDLQANVVIQNTYMVGLLFGRTTPQFEPEVNRYGISASLLLGNFRLTYALQQNVQGGTGISLPASHLVSAGYDFYEEEEERPRLF